MPTVLVVENDVPAMRLMAWGLMEAGFEVAVAHVPEADDHLTFKRPDVIVFNTLKRNDEKARLVARFRELAPDARVIDLSAEPDGEPQLIFADVHLTIPVSLSELVNTLNELSA